MFLWLICSCRQQSDLVVQVLFDSKKIWKIKKIPTSAHRFRSICVDHNVFSNTVTKKTSSFLWSEFLGRKGVKECSSCHEWYFSYKKKEERIAVIASYNSAGNYHDTITIFFLAWMTLRGELYMFVLHSKRQGQTYFSTDRVSGPFKLSFNEHDIFSTSHITNLDLEHFDQVIKVPDLNFCKD